jgi:hypothetical protein
MFSKPFAVAAHAIACVIAAVGGAYVAVSQNQEPARVQAGVTASVDRPQPANPAVPETEAIVAPTAQLPVEQPRAAAPIVASNRPDQPTNPEGVSTGASRSSRRSDKPAVPARPAPAAEPETKVVPAPPRTETHAATRTDAFTATPPPVEAPRSDKPPPPPSPVFEDLIVPSAAVVGLQIESAVSTERASIEDRVEARVTRDLAVDGRTAIPAGTRVVGSVTLVEKGGKIRERSRLGVRFHTLVLADGTELPIRTDPILREGESPGGESTRKIGGAAAGGAILGAIIGGKKGAIVGGATGAAGGTAVVMAGDRNAAVLPVGAVVTVRLAAPLTVSVEKR